MITCKSIRIKGLFLISLITGSLHAAPLSGSVQAGLVNADNTRSYQHQGSGILRHDDNALMLRQAMLHLDYDLTSDLSIDVVGNYYQDGEQHMGLTQALLIYKPISKQPIKFKARIGFFYPRISLENVEQGWSSPYTYTTSAVNSWIGEELRTAGFEFTLYSPGRTRRSAWSWEAVAATFKGNDPLGTLLGWRGFAMHDRQSLHQDKVTFAPYPTVIDEDGIKHPNYVEPFHELDGRWGFYAGAHLEYLNSTKLRYYLYDNRGDPLEVNAQRLYAWRTKFHAISALHRLTQNTRVISQWMTGTSLMGENVVNINFDAWYIMLSHQIESIRLSARFDRFMVRESDGIPEDKNNSDGIGLTLAVRTQLSEQWQLGFEQHFNRNSAQNRVTLDLAVDRNQSQSLIVIQFHW
jgi:hypothetical protein